MGEKGSPSVFDHPIWYEPLRAPSWLLPATEPDAPLVVFIPGDPGSDEAPGHEELRAGLPMYLADAVRFSTVARTSVRFDRLSPAKAVRCEVDATETSLNVRMKGTRGEDLGTVSEATGDDAALGRAIGALPGAIAAALRPAGVRSVWSTVFQPPIDAHAAEFVRAYEVCRMLRNPQIHQDDPDDSESTARRRAAVDGFLGRLAEISGRATSPFASMLFFAGLAATHHAGNRAYLGYRLSANGRCTTATDPRDPVFRISVLVFRLLGDPVIAGQRARTLASAGDPELDRWLSRVQGVGALL